MVDLGCGEMPYADMMRQMEIDYRGADIGDHGSLRIDHRGRVPLPDSSAGAVLSIQVLEHVRDLDAYCAEIRRLLSDDGILLLSTHGTSLYHPHPEDHRRWTRTGLIAELADRGLVVEGVHAIVGPLATSTLIRLTGFAFALRKVPVLGDFLASVLAGIMNLRAKLEDRSLLLTFATTMRASSSFALEKHRRERAHPFRICAGRGFLPSAAQRHPNQRECRAHSAVVGCAHVFHRRGERWICSAYHLHVPAAALGNRARSLRRRHVGQHSSGLRHHLVLVRRNRVSHANSRPDCIGVHVGVEFCSGEMGDRSAQEFRCGHAMMATMQSIDPAVLQQILAAHLATYRNKSPHYQVVMLETLRELWIGPHRNLLDVGGGTGVIAQAISELFPVARVECVDVVDRFCPSLRVPTRTYDGRTLPYETGSFDAATLNNVMHHVPVDDRAGLLREIRRVVEGPLYIKDHETGGKLDDLRLATLDAIGNIPFGGMVWARYLDRDEWEMLAKESGYRIAARAEPRRYRRGAFAILFPNSLEVTMRFEPA